MRQIRLKSGRERSVLRRHPWIFSGAIEEIEGEPGIGETVEVFSHDHQWLARGAYSPNSQIRARIWTWDPDEPIDADFFRRRLDRSIDARRQLARTLEVTAYREVHAESDGLPGVILDRYNDNFILQLLSAGAEHWREVIVAYLKRRKDCAGIYERSDVDVRQLEGLPSRRGYLSGEGSNEALIISEYKLRYKVDIHQGQKTGFYLDQRENRRLLREWIQGGEVLDCFAYTGGFTVSALAAGADAVLSIDTSSSALALASENVILNDLPHDRCEWIESDVFAELRALRDQGRTFDAVILDPPRFARRASHVQRASRGYKDINLLAFKLLRPGGLLFTYSCSGAVDMGLFQKIVAGAALDARVEAAIVAWLGQPSDHPVALSFPEGRYLKGLVCQVAS
ncbi:MAG: 23S rRNA methyltransferase [Anaerolineae bacterium SM23_ 63]|nr:MAG: 23S rRNA methyltransferase [Anaerolineae bacterium SM23_ 63]HEY47672.1 23S rRNA (cytosine(1962)-C(5))-methyltransferase RlmI [Anaerolineae bacterium]